MRRRYGVAGLLLVLCSFFVFWVGSASGVSDPPFADDEDTTALSGALDLRDSNGSTNVTECPQAGLRGAKPAPLNHHAMDETEQKSDAGNDVRVNQDYACQPQDETALDVNPTSTKNILAGANDYRLGWGASGFYASTDNGEHGTTASRRSRRCRAATTSTAVAIRPSSSTGAASRTTRRSTSTALTTRAASG